MKKLSILIAVVFAALVCSSCSKDGASVSITNKNLVGTWALVQTTTYEGQTIDVTSTSYEDYEEIVFTDYSLTLYSWWDTDYKWDAEKGEDVIIWEWSDWGELEYHIRDNIIWAAGINFATIKKLTTKELLLDRGEGEISLYRKK